MSKEKEFLILEPIGQKVFTSSEVLETLNQYEVEINPETDCAVFEVKQVGDSVFFLMEVKGDA